MRIRDVFKNKVTMVFAALLTLAAVAWSQTTKTKTAAPARTAAPKAADAGQFPSEDSIKPLPPPAIPDNPPPHEGAMANLVHTLAPPDLVQIEMIEALPGRPMSGEHLVRPDGMIGLGFYGDVYVQGLTARQAKEKVLLHLRKYVSDESLGLLLTDDTTGRTIAIEPAFSDRMLLEVHAYNSAFYYVQGDVQAPGRLPFTGRETVLDALNHAGGLASTADPKNIQLVRPGRGNAAAKSYAIDLNAILAKGDTTANLQLFPGDRLIVGHAAAPASTKPKG